MHTRPQQHVFRRYMALQLPSSVWAAVQRVRHSPTAQIALCGQLNSFDRFCVHKAAEAAF